MPISVEGALLDATAATVATRLNEVARRLDDVARLRDLALTNAHRDVTYNHEDRDQNVNDTTNTHQAPRSRTRSPPPRTQTQGLIARDHLHNIWVLIHTANTLLNKYIEDLEATEVDTDFVASHLYRAVGNLNNAAQTTATAHEYIHGVRGIMPMAAWRNHYESLQ